MIHPFPKPPKKRPRKAVQLKRSRIKKKSRKPSETLRIYGGKKRIEFVKSLPCAACGVVGYSENAHLTPKSEKGTGYKGGYRFIAPLCGPSVVRRWVNGVEEYGPFIGCHRQFDEFNGIFYAEHPRFDPIKASADCEKAWLAHYKEKA